MKHLLTLFGFILAISASAQFPGIPDGLDRQQLENQITGLENPDRNGWEVLTIPVVVHVLHTGEPIDLTPRFVEQPYTPNISDAQIKSAIENLNARFRNTWFPYWVEPDDSTGTIQPTSVDTKIEFVLAYANPNGMPTSGILRHNLDSISAFVNGGIRTADDQPGADANYIKTLTGWDPTDYMNVWVVPQINGNAGGCGTTAWGTMPTTQGPGAGDGIVIQWNRIGYGAYENVNVGLNVHFTQAVGRYLGLYPTYYNTLTVEQANIMNLDSSSCDLRGDYICDTPATIRNCSNLCTPKVDMPDAGVYPELVVEPDTYNYMDDAGVFCRQRFTAGQAERMREVLESFRSDLYNPAPQGSVTNLELTLSVDRIDYEEFAPVVIVKNTGTNTVTDYNIELTIQSTDSSYTYTEADFGAILPGSSYIASFPPVSVEKGSIDTLLALVTYAGNFYLGDDLDVAVIDQTVNDGFLEIRSQHESGYGVNAQVSIYDLDNDIEILDARKYYNNQFVQQQRQQRARYGTFAGYMNSPYGGIAPFGTNWYLNVPANAEFDTQSRFYLPPGNYEMRLSSYLKWTNGPYTDQYQLMKDCENGCFFEVNRSGLDSLFFIDQTDVDVSQDPLYHGYYLDGSVTYSNPQTYPFTISAADLSASTPCADLNNDGFCDGDYTTQFMPEISISAIYPGPTTADIRVSIDRLGVYPIDSINLTVTDNAPVPAVVLDTTVSAVYVNEEYYLTKPETSIQVTGLSSETDYLFIASVGSSSLAVTVDSSFTTPPDPCSTSTLTYDGITYDLVPIGNQCWFASNLAADQFSNGDPISEVIPAQDWVDSCDANVPALAAAQGDPALVEDLGYVYNVFSVIDDRGLCPAGWRVAHEQDWSYLDSISGQNTAQKLSVAPDDPYANIFLGQGTDLYGFKARLAAGRRWVDGQFIGYNAWWTGDPLRDISQYQPSTNRLRVQSRTIFNREEIFSKNVGTLEADSTGTIRFGLSVRCVDDNQPIVTNRVGNMKATTSIPNPNGEGLLIVDVCNFDPRANIHDSTIESLIVDECGICGGLGIPEGDCDCNGNIEDALGICGGDCDIDLDGDGICDNVDRFFGAGTVAGCDSSTVNYNGYEYPLVQIGDQCWFKENLRTETYNTGSPVALVTVGTAWSDLSTGARCAYDNDLNSVAEHGYLYNWYAVEGDSLCPAGWRVPSDQDWLNLEQHLGMDDFELKKTSYRGEDLLIGSQLTLGGVSNFDARLGGIRQDFSGSFSQLGEAGYYWTVDSYRTPKISNRNNAWFRGFFDQAATSAGVTRNWNLNQTSNGKGHGMSVKCVSDVQMEGQ